MSIRYEPHGGIGDPMQPSWLSPYRAQRSAFRIGTDKVYGRRSYVFLVEIVISYLLGSLICFLFADIVKIKRI